MTAIKFLPALITTILALIGLFVAFAVRISYGNTHSLARERIAQCLLFSAVFGAITLALIVFL